MQLLSVAYFQWVQQQTHPKVMTGNGQLTRGEFIKKDFLRNPHFSKGWVATGFWVAGKHLADLGVHAHVCAPPI
jgi:hypothetical protein